MCTNAIAANDAAPARSEMIITRRRSNRSPSEPAIGAARPPTPIHASSAALTQTAEPVRSSIVATMATYAASPPAIEIARAAAMRRTCGRWL